MPRVGHGRRTLSANEGREIVARRTKQAALLVFVLVLAGSVARAAERAEMMYSRGLVELHAQRYQEAIVWFDRAVEAEPANATARYYRAMARARIEDRAGAIVDLEQALRLQPDFGRARLELGGLLTEEERYEEAIAQLKQIRAAELQGDAALLIGVAELRRGNLDAARTSLRFAAERDPRLAATSSYYQGLIAYRQHENRLARQQFAAAIARQPGAAVNREALGALHGLRSGATQRYMLYAEAGFQYDSNVCLLPTDDSVGCAPLDSSDVGKGDLGSEGDGRAVFTVGGLVKPVMTERFQLTTGYEFFQSVHFDLEEFNLQDHRPRVQATGDLGVLLLGLLGQYDYYLLQTNSFLQEITALPWVTVPEGGVGRTELFYRMRRRDFKMLLFDVRDAFNHAAGARQVFYLGNPASYAFLGYRYDNEDPDEGIGAINPIDAQAFAYDGHEASVGIRWQWPYDIPTEASFAYRNERYDGASRPSDGGDRRKDDEYRVRAYIEVPWTAFAPDFSLSQYLSFGLAYMWNLNDSNQGLFDYQRHIASFTLQARY